MAKKKVKKKPKWNENSAIRSALRRIFVRSPIVIDVKKAARREIPKYKKDGSLAKRPSVQYKCAECGKWFKGTEIAVDHIVPVIDNLKTFEDWNTFIERLFCEAENLQVLCNYKLKDIGKHGDDTSCHYKKTQEERLIRKANQ